MTKKERLICEKIYNDNHKRINWYIWKHYGSLSEEEIHDIMQDVWKALCQDIAEVSKRSEEGQWAWLITVVKNRVKSGYRNHERDKKLEEKLLLNVDDYPEAKSAEAHVLEKVAAEEILNKLTREERQLLFQKYQDPNLSEESGILGKTANAIACKLYRVRGKLKEYMKEGDGDDDGKKKQCCT